MRLSWLTVHELRQLAREVETELDARRRRAPRAREPLRVTPTDLQRKKAQRLLSAGGAR